MKAAIICGSRDGGVTSEMCRSFSNGLAAHGICADVFFPIKMNIAHCTGCGSCSGNGVCELSDDMDIFYETFRKCDLFVLATPIHFSGPSSVIKTVIDRFQPIWFKAGEHPAFVVALLSGGGPSPNYRNTVSILKAFSITAEMEWLGHLEISDTDKEGMLDAAKSLSFEYGKEVGLFLINNQK